MAVLPEGFALPPVPYLLALVATLIVVGVGLRRRRVEFGHRHVLALVPWMAAGAALHVLYIVEAVPAVIAPLLGTPAVYATVGVLAGGVWLVADLVDRPVGASIGLVGAVVCLLAVAGVGAVGLDRGALRVGPSVVALLGGIVLTGVVWVILRRVRPEVDSVGWVGIVTIGAHTLDGVSTAVGVDWLGFGERTPLSRAIIEFGAGLPTADVLGATWLFVVVKILIASWIVAAFVEYVRDRPAEGYALLGLVTAVGLGPAVHNLLLFAVG